MLKPSNGGNITRGRFTAAGGTLTINLAAGKSWQTSSCGSADNFNKTLPPATVMCFDGSDDVFYEKVNQ